jgi:5-methylcytosine-specific restriction protein A
MPRAPKACSQPTCTNTQPCPAHPKIAWAGSTRRRSLPPDWEARRRIVLDRDPVCTDGQACHHLATSTEVHHRGNRDDHRVEQLAGICRDCHNAETQKQAAAGRHTNTQGAT